MTIQKTGLRFGDKTIDVILEDGVVFYADPLKPGRITEVPVIPGMKVTSLEEAKRIVLQKLRKSFTPDMSFSD